MAGGRPTTYTKEVVELANEYLTAWTGESDVIPSVEGLAAYIDRARSTLYEWAKDKDKKEFSDILAKINELQKRTLINKGLSGDFNSNIAKLVLGKHGMSEKHQQEVTGANGGPQEVKFVVEFVGGDDGKPKKGE